MFKNNFIKSLFNILTLYVFILLLGIMAFYAQKYHYIEHIWDCWSVIDTASAVALATLAIIAYYEYIKGKDVIKLYFLVGDKKIDTNLSLLRKDFSRSELLGILGMIQKNPKERFKISYFKNPEILNKIQMIQKGQGKEFIIKLEEDELSFFDIDTKTSEN